MSEHTAMSCDSPCAPMVTRVADAGLVMGRVFSLDAGVPMILFEYDGEHYCLPAFATMQLLCIDDVGAEVCIGFSDQKLDRPIVLGMLHRSTNVGGGVMVSNDQEIILRCGKACIQLKADGTVSIRGTNVASRASHTNRIRGGNVQIN